MILKVDHPDADCKGCTLYMEGEKCEIIIDNPNYICPCMVCLIKVTCKEPSCPQWMDYGWYTSHHHVITRKVYGQIR